MQLLGHLNGTNNIYLVLELCEGGDLASFIRNRGKLPEPLALSFLKQMTDGLKFLNDLKLMHRDLKPANILLTEASENAILKLADFGFIRYMAEEAALARTNCGTPLYKVNTFFFLIYFFHRRSTYIKRICKNLFLLNLLIFHCSNCSCFVVPYAYRPQRFLISVITVPKLMFGVWVVYFMRCSLESRPLLVQQMRAT